MPHNPVIRTKWIQQINKHQEFDSIPIVYEVCADHFNPTDIQQRGKRSLLKKGALPKYFPERVIFYFLCISDLLIAHITKLLF